MYPRITIFATCCMIYTCSSEITSSPNNASKRARRSYAGANVFGDEMPFIVLLMGSRNYTHYFTGVAIKPRCVITSANGARSSFVEYVHYGRNHYWHVDPFKDKQWIDDYWWEGARGWWWNRYYRDERWRHERSRKGGKVAIHKRRLDPNYIIARTTFELWDYKFITLHYNDIGAVYTQYNMVFNTHKLFPILMVDKKALDKVLDNELLTFYGFGVTHNDTLRNIKSYFRDHHLRKTEVRSVDCYDKNLTKCCTYCRCFKGVTYSIPCLGDSGGPLIYHKSGRDYIVAINSVMYYCKPYSEPGQYFGVRTDSVLKNYIIDDLNFDLDWYDDRESLKPESLTSLVKQAGNYLLNETVRSSAISKTTYYLLPIFTLKYLLHNNVCVLL